MTHTRESLLALGVPERVVNCRHERLIRNGPCPDCRGTNIGFTAVIDYLAERVAEAEGRVEFWKQLKRSQTSRVLRILQRKGHDHRARIATLTALNDCYREALEAVAEKAWDQAIGNEAPNGANAVREASLILFDTLALVERIARIALSPEADA